MAEADGTDFRVIEQLLAGCQIDVAASEADGRLLSLAAMLGDDAIAIWLQQLAVGTTQADAGGYLGQLAVIAEQRLARLDDAQELPVLSLPEDDDDIRDRVDALVLWANGFVTGLGEGASLRGTDARQLLEQEPLKELLQDLTEITKAEVAAEDIEADSEAAEAAYFELVEFLRVATQLAYEELTPVRKLAVSEAPQVH
ncbi:MAG: UPF0149 family protein [Pseudomonadota bacterium]